MAQTLAALHAQLKACRLCAAQGHPILPPPIFSGAAGAQVMIVGQAPGRVETTETGLPFSGSAGKRLFRWLAEAGWEEAPFRRRQAMTAITKCFPGSNAGGRGDRVPSRAEQDLCRPWLEQELALMRPRVVVPVGGLAIQRFLGSRLRLADAVGRLFARPQDDAALTVWARHHLPTGACLLPLPHPSGASLWLNKPENRALVEQALAHLEQLNTGDR